MADELDVVDRLEHADDALADDEAVLAEHDANRHARRLPSVAQRLSRAVRAPDLLEEPRGADFGFQTISSAGQDAAARGQVVRMGRADQHDDGRGAVRDLIRRVAVIPSSPGIATSISTR